jgi:hypothetical protein
MPVGATNFARKSWALNIFETLLFVFYLQATSTLIGQHVAHAEMAQFANYVASVQDVPVAVIPTSLLTVGFSMKNQNKSSLLGWSCSSKRNRAQNCHRTLYPILSNDFLWFPEGLWQLICSDHSRFRVLGRGYANCSRTKGLSV